MNWLEAVLAIAVSAATIALIIYGFVVLRKANRILGKMERDLYKTKAEDKSKELVIPLHKNPTDKPMRSATPRYAICYECGAVHTTSNPEGTIVECGCGQKVWV